MISAAERGFQGKRRHSGSLLTCPRPSVVTSSPVRASTTARVGIPRTLNLLERVSLAGSPKGTANFQLISPRYSLNDFSSRSELTNTTFAFRRSPFLTAQALSSGVNPPAHTQQEAPENNALSTPQSINMVRGRNHLAAAALVLLRTAEL